jgi:hypothetical protein
VATRKQRKRTQKERRHEYETVWVDGEGNELEEPPDDAPAAPRERRPDGKKPQQKRPQQRSSRATRTPLPPSWQRAAKRAALLGAVIFVLFAILGSKGGKHQYGSALVLAVLYTAIFIPFTYYVDRFSYRRWQRKMGEQPTKR